MFNALESIRLKACVKGEIETAQMIKYMAKMFRNLIEWDDNIITVREEIAFLDEFLHIQEYRFEDEFSYEIHVQEEAYECKIPKMILQPLVENACVHGIHMAAPFRAKIKTFYSIAQKTAKRKDQEEKTWKNESIEIFGKR